MSCSLFVVLSAQTDAIHLQQGAFGKTKSFEQLATASAGRDVETLPLRSTEKEKHLEALEEKIASRCRKYNFNNNCHVLRCVVAFSQVSQGFYM